MASESTTPTASLAPGFRFHPTDDELVRYYLKRKVCRKPFRFDAISEIDVYKCEPWDLPGKSRLKSRDLEWYFFSVLDKKHGNGTRTNRATEKGYWKTTGKDRAILHKSRTVGMKKTHVYHSGRAPRGERTNWVMHEYRLVDEELEKAGIVQDAFVLCRIFQKSGSGPKNGEQYGAPFIEEEWENDELVMVRGEEAAEELVGDDDYLNGNYLEQIPDACIPSEVVPLPLNFYFEDNSNYVEESMNFNDDAQKHLVGMGENQYGLEQPDGQQLFDFPSQYDVVARTVKHEYIGEPSNTVNPEDADYLLDEPFLDATENTPFDGAFLETNDLSKPIEADPSGFDLLEEYLTFFDADDDTSQYMAFDSSKMMGSENLVYDQSSLAQMRVNGDTHQVARASQKLLEGHDNDVASSSKQESVEFNPDIQSPFIKPANRMLSSIPAAPAFASEFPAKDAAVRLSSTSQSSNSLHVTTGMIQIRNVTLSSNAADWLFGKHGDINITLSFGLSQSNSASLEPMAVLSSKAGSAMLWGWLYLMFIWVLILSMSYKIGTYFYTGNAA
ncbi:hypothetical protein F0562_025930 [Nyssa sinensis]|uniref:NAC domain-containing protein n=1 Tax=Nyssa sinensis TaxID=561372 RepID=A0A5J5B9G2_9ASTE|nr:hypothetical protein F0562_025930 [Nyssa sinensis]